MGEFDATKQANVILLLRGERFAGCDLPDDSSRSTPQAATMTTSSQNWSNVGTQATGLADDLDSALKQLLKGWEGKAADEFSTNVTKVVAFARQIAHVADTDNPAPAADGTANPFATSKSSTGYKQLFTGLASDVATYTGTSKAPGLPWETGRWWWKWYETWSFNYEVRDDSGVVNGDINGDKFVDFMRDHSIPTNDAADGLVSHPLPKDWPASVKAFEAKEFNTDQQNDCRAAGNDLATKYKDFGDGLGDALVAPTLSGSSGLSDTSGLGGTPGGGMTSGGMPSGGGGGGAGGVSGGAPNFTPPHLTDTGGSGGSSGSGGSGGGLPGGSGGGLPGGSGGTGSGGVGTGGSWPGGSGSGGSGSSGSGGSGPVTGSGSSTYGGGSDGSGSYGGGSGGSGGGSYDSGSGNYPGSDAGGWNDGSTGIDTGGVLAGYDPGTDGSGASGSGGYGSGGYGSGTPTGAGAGGFGSTGGLGTSAGSGLSGSAAGGSSAGGSGSGASGSGGLAPGSVGGAGSAGSASSGGGSGMMAPMMGGGGGGRGGQESQHQTWLVEDEDVWGAREGETAPPVIGGSL